MILMYTMFSRKSYNYIGTTILNVSGAILNVKNEYCLDKHFSNWKRKHSLSRGSTIFHKRSQTITLVLNRHRPPCSNPHHMHATRHGVVLGSEYEPMQEPQCQGARATKSSYIDYTSNQLNHYMPATSLTSQDCMLIFCALRRPMSCLPRSQLRL